MVSEHQQSFKQEITIVWSISEKLRPGSWSLLKWSRQKTLGDGARKK